jgi:hypothetical protein
MEQKQFNLNIVVFMVFAAVVALIVLIALVVVWPLRSGSAANPALVRLSPNAARSTERAEARGWLATNPSTSVSPFATGRFDTRQDAQAFVEHLYALGAQRVDVTHIQAEDWRLKQEGGPYADALIITLPPDAPQRRSLFAVAAQETPANAQGAIEDVGQDELRLAWR